MATSKKKFLLSHRILGVILFLLFLTFVFPFVLWYFQPTQTLSVVVIDKTTAADYREHNSFFWLMKHWKFVEPSSDEFYDEKKDYYGFFPQDSSFSDDSELNLHHTDLLYIADTYGVYDYPVRYDEYESLLSEQNIRVQLKYGGLNDTEMDKIEDYNYRNRMSIAEFNTLQDPQLRDRVTQKRLEKMFGVRFSGALGRYYEDLNTAAYWIKERYKEQEKPEWEFSGSGIIILDARNDFGPINIIVLHSDDIQRTPVVLRNSDHRYLEGTGSDVPYYYFFEILDLDSSAIPIAHFELQCTESGKEKLERSNIPLSFPAVVLSDSTERNIYFAGDFADNEVETILVGYRKIGWLLSHLSTFYFVSDQTRFFWKFYLPMMRNILTESYERSIRK